METDEAHTTISVRAVAHRTVPPDRAWIFATVTSVADSASDAKAAADEQLGAVLDGLVALGATARTAETTRDPLTWAHHSVRTHPEERHDERTGEYGPTGRYVASHELSTELREFDRIRDVEMVLTSRDSVAVRQVSWSVDDDNGAWAHVRADAIHAALLKGQDYAAALGGRVFAVTQVADAGLLDGGDQGGRERATTISAAAMYSRDSDGALSLEPEPQTLTAVIDARLNAVIPAMPPR